MPVAWPDIKTAVRGWLLAGTGLADGKVIWKNQNAPRPPVPFVEINPRLALARLGIFDEERVDPNNPGVVQRVGQRKLTVSCHAYGPDAIALMERAQEYLDTYAARALFQTAGIAVLDRGSVHDLTQLLETQFEERTQLDVIFGLAVSTAEEVGWIQTVDIGATLLNPDGSTGGSFTQTITLP